MFCWTTRNTSQCRSPSCRLCRRAAGPTWSGGCSSRWATPWRSPSTRRRPLVRAALARLIADEPPADEEEAQPAPERARNLHEQRLEAVLEQLRRSGARSVADLGCGEGRLLRLLLPERQFERILGMDVAYRSLEIARERLRLDRLPPALAERLTLIQGSLLYRDARLAGYDAAVVEVVEHLDPARLAAFERVVFEHARPGTVVLTTPNAEYNVRFPTLAAGTFRHSDHRFEWSRAEFSAWAERVAAAHGYRVEVAPIGPEDAEVGAPSQLARFWR
ncbi:MAG TPA: methyltransferase [Roseiflexaceae bacterium]|nr:methyltransferase [Roseiflexaceae bacterium]